MLNAPPSFPQLADWFSEQFSTAVLILPFILTLTLPSALSGFRFRQLLPVLALVLSIALGVAVGGAGSITFPLPALIWCAVRHPAAADLSADFSHWHRRNTAGR